LPYFATENPAKYGWLVGLSARGVQPIVVIVISGCAPAPNALLMNVSAEFPAGGVPTQVMEVQSGLFSKYQSLAVLWTSTCQL
jgi:hypothetical protein